jgi:hypothetical protein
MLGGADVGRQTLLPNGIRRVCFIMQEENQASEPNVEEREQMKVIELVTADRVDRLHYSLAMGPTTTPSCERKSG